MIPYGEGDQAYLVVDQTGVIHFLDENGGKPGKAFLDLRKALVTLKKGFDERGSLGVALHPKFSSNKKVYVAETLRVQTIYIHTICAHF